MFESFDVKQYIFIMSSQQLPSTNLARSEYVMSTGDWLDVTLASGDTGLSGGPGPPLAGTGAGGSREGHWSMS